MDTIGFGGGEGLVALGDASEKFLVGFLDAVANEGQIGLAHGAAKFAYLRGNVEQQG